MSYIYPHRTFTDTELSGNQIYVPTQRAFYGAMEDANFSFFTGIALHISIWLSGTMKMHLFPGADMLSSLVKKILPDSFLRMLLRKMQ